MISRCAATLISLLQLWPAFAARAEYPGPDARRVTLQVHAGDHDRVNVPVSVLVDAPEAKSVWMELEDGSFDRAGVVAPGIEHAAAQGRKELFFSVNNLKKGEVLNLVARLSPHPVEHRGYVWTGEPRQSRRLSCVPCHQGLALPTAEELQQEREVMAATGKPPPMPGFPPLPTTKGRDFRWHEELKSYQHSACFECHGRHFVEYRFGQPVGPGTKWAPEPSPCGVKECESVYYRVFRVKGDQALTQSSGISPPGLPPGIHFGAGSGLQQRHVRILSEEANKFIGRQRVLVNWVDRQERILVEEERQLTLKNMRAANGSLALWIDCVSRLQPSRDTGEEVENRVAGWRFAFPADEDVRVAYRQGAGWQAATFTADGHGHTAACFAGPAGGRPADPRAPEGGQAIGFDFPFDPGSPEPQKVRCRLWLQGGEMSESEIESLAAHFQDPLRIEWR